MAINLTQTLMVNNFDSLSNLSFKEPDFFTVSGNKLLLTTEAETGFTFPTTYALAYKEFTGSNNLLFYAVVNKVNFDISDCYGTLFITDIADFDNPLSTEHYFTVSVDESGRIGYYLRHGNGDFIFGDNIITEILPEDTPYKITIAYFPTTFAFGINIDIDGSITNIISTAEEDFHEMGNTLYYGLAGATGGMS